MSSKRAVTEFINDAPVDEVVDWFDVVEDEALQPNYYEEEVAATKRVQQHRDHLDDLRKKAYESKISAQLEECGRVLENKLKWADNYSAPTPIPVEPTANSAPAVVQQRGGTKPSIKFGKFRPLDVDVKIGSSSEIVYYQEPKVVVKHGICKHYASGKECPFGNECRYSHVRAANTLTTAAGNSRKIWMCRHAAKGCRSTDCGYAHSVADVRATVKPCTLNFCNRVKRVNGKHVNSLVEGGRPCMRLHAGESVENFIQRTSKV